MHEFGEKWNAKKGYCKKGLLRKRVTAKRFVCLMYESSGNEFCMEYFNFYTL